MEVASASVHRRSKSAVMLRRGWALELGFGCRRGTPITIEIANKEFG